ncbi:12265_t:CDS:2 [Gigaspora margarita]|uniref:12265_t:CDS:1 n=1 Tax=Gigaspora margarita TaxID=4874 RepID=A0ABN7UHQ5_GIGMA|nr:12265_t:CDS:2 [Gigaspora margarita]
MDTSLSNFDKMEHLLGNIKELSEKSVKSSDVMNNKEEELANALMTKLIEESRVKNVEQRIKKGNEMEITIGMTAALKQVADNNGFI